MELVYTAAEFLGAAMLSEQDANEIMGQLFYDDTVFERYVYENWKYAEERVITYLFYRQSDFFDQD